MVHPYAIPRAVTTEHPGSQKREPVSLARSVIALWGRR